MNKTKDAFWRMLPWVLLEITAGASTFNFPRRSLEGAACVIICTLAAGGGLHEYMKGRTSGDDAERLDPRD